MRTKRREAREGCDDLSKANLIEILVMWATEDQAKELFKWVFASCNELFNLD